MDAELRVNVLGPLEVRRGGELVAVPAGNPGVVLAVLAASAGHAVTVSALAGYVWEDEPPKRVPSAMQGLVLRLRQAVGPPAIATVPHGYLLDVGPEQVDLLRFRRLASAATTAAVGDGSGDDDGARLDAALALWRGEPFQGLESERLRREFGTQLVEERLAAVQRRVDLELAAGAHQRAVVELRRLTSQYPLRETLWHRLILALAGDGRYAEAVAAFHEARGALREQLGVDPSAELQAVYRALLSGSAVGPAAASWQPEPRVRAGAEPAVRAGAVPAATVPRQLPASPRSFVGRRRELARLSGALLDGDRAAGAAVVVGAGGMGKTWLALRWAHEALDRFVDGQLYIDLRGYDPASEPTPAAVALRGFLAALGVERTAIPVELDAQIGLYRGLTAGRRLLVVLDNALDTEHVRPLLPDTSTNVVLVTGRHDLAGMVTGHGAERIRLDALDSSDARELLVQLLDPAAVAAEPAAVAELLARCAGLPLAISIVAARATGAPSFPLSAVAEELGAVSGRLDALSADEVGASLRAAFAASFRTLRPAAARLFGLFGLTPTADVGVPAAAALAGLPAGGLRGPLRELEAAHLITRSAPDRYRTHDLIRLYAAETAGGGADREAALRRLVDHHLHTAHAGERLLDPHRTPIDLDPPAPGCQPLELPDRDAALRWFDAESDGLLAVQRLAADRGWHSRVWQLAWATGAYHWRCGDPTDNLASWRAAVAATDRLGRPELRFHAYRRLGLAVGRAGDFPGAARLLERSRLLAAEVGDVVEEAHALQSRAWLSARQGRNEEALSYALRALRLTDPVDDPLEQANSCAVAGWYHARAGQHEQASALCGRALELFREHDEPEGQADTLDSLGLVAFGTGRYGEALEHYRSALALFRDLGHRYEEANTLAGIGDAHRAGGHPDLACRAWRQALDLYRAQGRAADAGRVAQRLAETRA